MPILVIHPSTRSLHDLRKRVFRNATDIQTHIQTHGHRDSMTESAQWANSLNFSGIQYRGTKFLRNK